jgi:hypothetical protein
LIASDIASMASAIGSGISQANEGGDEHVAHDDFGNVDLRLRSVAQDARAACEHPAERRHGSFDARFLPERERRIEDDDRDEGGGDEGPAFARAEMLPQEGEPGTDPEQ